MRRSSSSEATPIEYAQLVCLYDDSKGGLDGVILRDGTYYIIEGKRSFEPVPDIDGITRSAVPAELMREMSELQRNYAASGLAYNAARDTCRMYIFLQLLQTAEDEALFAGPTWLMVEHELLQNLGELSVHQVYVWRKAFSEAWFSLKGQLGS